MEAGREENVTLRC